MSLPQNVPLCCPLEQGAIAVPVVLTIHHSEQGGVVRRWGMAPRSSRLSPKSDVSLEPTQAVLRRSPGLTFRLLAMLGSRVPGDPLSNYEPAEKRSACTYSS